MNLEVWKFVVCVLVTALVFLIIGIRYGMRKGTKPKPAGVIDFEAREDGSIGCVFKLDGDIDWIAKQSFIIFEVRNGDKV